VNFAAAERLAARIATVNARVFEVSEEGGVDHANLLNLDYADAGHAGFASQAALDAATANDAVTYAKMQNVSATDKVLGRATAGAGDVEEIPCTAAGRALLDDADAAAQRATLVASYTIPIVIIGGANTGWGPADGVTYYAGCFPKNPQSSANTARIYIRRAGIIRIAEINTYATTAGTNESWSFYVRLNDTTDYLIATISASTNERTFSNTAINITVAPGDFVEIKIVCPTWATNPSGVGAGGYLLVE
jgi:hypothetical protein